MENRTDSLSVKTLRLLVGLAILSFLPTLFLPYVGEEGFYTISSMEMVYNNQWLIPSHYGLTYPRPPLVNWLMIPLTEIMGWDRILLASRLITAMFTIGTGLLLMGFVKRVYGNPRLAVLVGIIFFSGDILFKRGWLAYADAHFSFFIFLAISSMLLAVHEKRTWFFIGALLGLVGAFMSKALTGYVYYGVAVMVVLVLDKDGRKILFSPLSILLHLVALAYPFFWWSLVGGSGTDGGMLVAITSKLSGEGTTFALLPYLGKRLAFLGESFARLLPGSMLLLWVFWKKRELPSFKNIPLMYIVAWFTLVNYLPYLLSPKTGIRYIMPLYPWFALLIAYLLEQRMDIKLGRWIVYLFGGLIALKFMLGIFIYPWYETKFRGGDFKQTAEHVLQLTNGHPLYVNDVTSMGFCLTATIDTLQRPAAPLLMPEEGWSDGFILSSAPSDAKGRLVHTYEFARNDVYLLCRGTACPEDK
jgi:hypothetical protein